MKREEEEGEVKDPQLEELLKKKKKGVQLAELPIKKEKNTARRAANKKTSQLKELKKTYLNSLIPRSRDNGGRVGTWRESNSRDPVLVGWQSVDTVTNGVPDLDGLVTRSRNNLSQVLGDGHRQNVTGVASESHGGLTSLQVPQSQGLVPRTGQSVSTVGRDGDVLDDVGVANEGLLWNTVLVVLTTSQFPGDQGLVSGTGQKEVWLGLGGGQGSDPTVVALKGASQNQNFFASHFVCVVE